jgi:hypothetical protein
MSGGDEKTIVEQLVQTLGVAAGTVLAEEIRQHITQLGETDDLNWIDMMVWRLTTEGVPLPAVIQGLAAKAAHLRLLGAGRRGGNPTKVMTDFAKDVAHVNSAFLRGMKGVGLEEADLRAVVSVEDELGDAPKASSLSHERPGSGTERPVMGVLTNVGRAFEEIFPQMAAELAEYTAPLAEKAKKDKKHKKPNKVGTRR